MRWRAKFNLTQGRNAMLAVLLLASFALMAPVFYIVRSDRLWSWLDGLIVAMMS